VICEGHINILCNSIEISDNPPEIKVVEIFRISWVSPIHRARHSQICGTRAFCRDGLCAWAVSWLQSSSRITYLLWREFLLSTQL